MPEIAASPDSSSNHQGPALRWLGNSGLLRRSEAPASRVQAVRARGASDRAQMQERFLRELGAAELAPW